MGGIAGALLLGWCSAAPRAEDWPVYQHDHRRSAASGEQLEVHQLESDWVYRSAVRPVPAWGAPAKWDAYAGIRGLKSMRNYDPVFHPVVAGDRLWFGSSADDTVRCLDTRSGAVQWTFSVDAPVRLAPAFVEGRLYFGSDDGYAYCLEAATGRLIWKFCPARPAPLVLHDGRFISLWPCRTGVLVVDGTAYCAMGMLPWKESYLCAVDALTGRAEGPGRFVRRVEGVTFEGALLASSQRLISPQGRVPPLLFNRADGTPLGALEGGGGSFVLLTDDAHVLHGPGNKTGWVQESQEAGRTKVATFEGATMMIVRGDRSYAQTETDLMAIDRGNRRTVWKQASAFPHTLILAGDSLFAGGTDAVGAFRAADGERVWEAPVEGRAFGLVVANGALFVSTDEGLIHCFRPGSPAGREQASPATVLPPTSEASAATVPPVESFADPALAGRWVFRTDQVRSGAVRNLAGGTDAALLGKAEFVPAGAQQVWRLDGATRSALITGDLASPELPREAITAEAWVRVDQPLPWGGLIGALQDNGDFERGWLLGFVESRFSFALAARDGNQRLTYLTAKSAFEKGGWYHVMGTYDGQAMRLYIDGALEGESGVQRGPIAYPPNGFYEIGAYHDKDEYYRTSGLLREARVYRRALTAQEAREHATAAKEATPDRLVLKAGPILAFAGQGEASVWWETSEPAPSRLDWGSSGGPYRTLEDSTPKTTHRVVLTGLRYDRVYEYIIKAPVGGVLRETEAFECDTYFDFSLVTPHHAGAASVAGADGSSVQRLAQELVDVSGVHVGLVLWLGAGNLELPQAVVQRGPFRVQVMDVEPEATARARRTALAAGCYGARIAALRVNAWDDLPLVGACANLIVVLSESGVDPARVDPAAVLRMVRPFGGVALVGLADATVADSAEGQAVENRWRAAAGQIPAMQSERRGRWLRFERGAAPGAGEWTHQYGTAANTAFGGESLQGATSIQDLEVQWLGRPGPRAQADRNGRKPAPLASDGRLFVQGLQRIVALDAYNGSVQWTRELPYFERFNLPRDCSNWCADRDRLYTVVKGECWQLAAATGELQRRHAVVSGARRDWRYDWGFVSAQGDQLMGSAVKEGAAFTEFWGGSDAGWYDATAGPATFKVGSDNLFALDRPSGKLRWQYAKGIILNPTITIASNEVYLVETRHPVVLAAETRRLGQPELWQDLWLVALDVSSGTLRWERQIRPAPGVVMLSLAAAQDRLVLVSSGGGRYHAYGLDRADGQPRWEQSFAWPKDNHGGHMARPTIVGGAVFVRPQVLDLGTGQVRSQAVPSGGCGTYAASERALIFRDGNVTLWDFGRGEKTSWSRLRPDCWLSTIPASGLLLSPEAGGGCSCGSWLETSIVFRPALHRRGGS